MTSVAPGAEKRSVIWVLIAELCAAASRCRRASRRPMRRAGSTNTGNRISASRLICQEIPIITTSVRASVTTLLTTPDNVVLNARWAPMTSLLRRLTRAPVRVRVKKAIGIRCTWSNTAVRRSRIRLSPMLDESHRLIRPKPASTMAITAMARASSTTTRSSRPSTIALTTRPANTGVATASTASATLSTRKPPRARRCGAANDRIRRAVSLENEDCAPELFIVRYIWFHAVISMLMTPT